MRIEELTALLNAAALGMKSSCAFYDRYRTHKVPSFSLYKEDSENQWKSTEEGKTNHLDMSIAFPVRVEIPLQIQRGDGEEQGKDGRRARRSDDETDYRKKLAGARRRNFWSARRLELVAEASKSSRCGVR